MIFTRLYEGQGLGNQLWVYAACRGLARRLGVEHGILNLHAFKGSSFLTLDPGTPPSPEARLQVFNERLYYDPDLDFIASDFDERVLGCAGPTILEGLYQSERYLFGTNPAELLAIKGDFLDRRLVTPDTCVLNLRGGEYKRHKRFILPLEYWHLAMANVRRMTGIDRFMVVTDDPAYARALFPEIPVMRGGIAECYVALHQAAVLVVSNSTFSYFPIKTAASPKFVIAPRYWGRFADANRRWASPANLYAGWLWQDRDGNLLDYDECAGECSEQRAFYQREYAIAAPRALFQREGLKRFVPARIRKAAKRMMGVFFPRHIG